MKEQNLPFIKMVTLWPTDTVERFENNTIDAGIPQTIMEFANKASGFAQVDADIITEEV